MTVPERFGFYAILTDPVRGYEYMAEMLIENGIRFIQLRMKKADQKEVLKTAEKLRKTTMGTKSLFIVNDDPAIAAAVGADGVHLGQEDMTFEEAKEIMGPDKIIGLSTHNPDQVRVSCGKGPSYIGVGPVYRTPAKEKPDPVLGIEGLKGMLKIATVPAVAIGAINETNLRDVLRAGAVNFCSVRPINQTREPEKALKALLKIYNEIDYNKIWPCPHSSSWPPASGAATGD